MCAQSRMGEIFKRDDDDYNCAQVYNNNWLSDVKCVL
jgi:hypothetical protein